MESESDIVTPESRNEEIERIHTEAVGTVCHGAAQIFAAVIRELNAELRKLGYKSTHMIAVTREHENNAQGLLESIKHSLADDLPVNPENAVEHHDDFDILNSEQTIQLASRVRQTFRDLMGAFDQEGK